MVKLAASVAVFAIAGAVAAADIVISNLPGNDGSQSFGINGSSRTKGMGFSMPVGNDYFLDNLIARLEITDLTVMPVFEIFSDVGGAAGVSLITLNNPAFPRLGVDNFSFTPGASFTLVGGRSYWIIASSANAVYNWKASSPAQTPTGIATHTGALWGTYVPSVSSSILTSYEINGTIVPATGTLAILSLGGLLAMRRRR